MEKVAFIINYLLNTILKQCDIMTAYIDNPQQKIYTVPRLE